MEQTEERKQQSTSESTQEALITELEIAVQANNFDRYFELLSKESPEQQRELCRNVIISNDGKAIHWAASQDNTGALQKLLDLGASIDEYNDDSLTPLFCAVAHGCFNCVKLLLSDRRTDINFQDRFGWTALHYSAANCDRGDQPNRLKICSLLLNLQRTNVSLRNHHHRTALGLLHEKRLEADEDDLEADYKTLLQPFFDLFALRKLKVQLFLSLKNARCSEQCSAEVCTHALRLPADICLKIARMLTVESLPKNT